MLQNQKNAGILNDARLWMACSMMGMLIYFMVSSFPGN